MIACGLQPCNLLKLGVFQSKNNKQLPAFILINHHQERKRSQCFVGNKNAKQSNLFVCSIQTMSLYYNSIITEANSFME